MKFELSTLFKTTSAASESTRPNEVTSILQEAIGVSGESKPEMPAASTDEQKTPE